MTDHRIDDAVMWRAIGEALEAEDVAHGLPHQWVGVAEYGASRGADPWPARAALVSQRLGCPRDVVPALEAASAALIEGDDDLRAMFVEWARADIATAAPLLAAFTGHGTDVDHPVVLVADDERAALAAWLSKDQGSPVRVVHAEVIGGGFSRRMWRVRVASASIDGQERTVIVRVEQGGMFGTDTAREVAAMQGLRRAGYRVPEILHVDLAGEALGEPMFVMAVAPGVVRIDDDGLADVIRSVAELHRVPVGSIDESARDADQVMHDNIDYWLGLYRQHSPIPVPLLEHAAAWLHRELRPTGPAAVIHGDAGPGNALFDDQEGLTVLDWEFAHVGDPAEDWAYLALIRGRRTMPAEEWKARILEVANVELSDEQWHMWLAFNHFRGACVNLTALTVFRNGPRRTADQLAIGIAVHLRFLGQLLDVMPQ